MSIQAILNNKGDDVVSIEAGASVRSALLRMDECQIGALIVCTQSDENYGIFTERDVMRAVVRGDMEVLNSPVRDHMSARPQCLSFESSIQEAMSIMTQMRFRHMPVIKDNRLCGIISLGDLVNFRINESEREAQAMKQYIQTA